MFRDKKKRLLCSFRSSVMGERDSELSHRRLPACPHSHAVPAGQGTSHRARGEYAAPGRSKNALFLPAVWRVTQGSTRDMVMEFPRVGAGHLGILNQRRSSPHLRGWQGERVG